MMPSSTTPQAPGTTRSSADSTRWQVLVPMTATSVPGVVTPHAGTDTWASTLAMATGVPGRSPVQRAASALTVTGTLADGPHVPRHPAVHEVREARVERAQVRRRSGTPPGATTAPCSRRCSCCGSRHP